ncbi:hypothetical protein M5K25_021469 [Dendrobium thyrsiflorum]|uniref:Uncharacterized protein n=1 Tax=Dendrobium thyrsiflorum TaxID=117978 RepID=A0ABD0UJE7_DENTH
MAYCLLLLGGIGIADQSSFCMSKIANVQSFAVGRHSSCLWIMQMQPFEETELHQPLVLIWQSAFASFSELFDVLIACQISDSIAESHHFSKPGKIDQANLLQKKIRSVVGEASLMMTIGSIKHLLERPSSEPFQSN